MDDALAEVVLTTDPEVAYLGALLHQPNAFRAVLAMHHVREDDFEDPRHRAVLGLVRMVVDGGSPPDPATVLAEAQRSGQVVGAHRVAGLSKVLVDCFTRCPLPAAIDSYAVAVLDGAVRRRILQAGQRLQQVADESALAEAIGMVQTEAVAVGELVERRRRAIEGDPQ